MPGSSAGWPARPERRRALVVSVGAETFPATASATASAMPSVTPSSATSSAAPLLSCGDATASKGDVGAGAAGLGAAVPSTCCPWSCSTSKRPPEPLPSPPSWRSPSSVPPQRSLPAPSLSLPSSSPPLACNPRSLSARASSSSASPTACTSPGTTMTGCREDGSMISESRVPSTNTEGLERNPHLNKDRAMAPRRKPGPHPLGWPQPRPAAGVVMDAPQAGSPGVAVAALTQCPCGRSRWDE